MFVPKNLVPLMVSEHLLEVDIKSNLLECLSIPISKVPSEQLLKYVVQFAQYMQTDAYPGEEENDIAGGVHKTAAFGPFDPAT